MTQLFLQQILLQDFHRNLHCLPDSLRSSRQELSHLRLIQGSMDKNATVDFTTGNQRHEVRSIFCIFWFVYPLLCQIRDLLIQISPIF